MTTLPYQSAWFAGLALALLLKPLSAAAQNAAVEVVLPEVTQMGQVIELTGTFTPRRIASLSPRISGLVSNVLVDAGDRVETGQVLVELDRELTALAEQQAQAVLKERDAALAEAERLRSEGARLAKQSHLPETEVQARVAAVALAGASRDRAAAELAMAQERLARHTVVAPFAGAIVRKLTEAGEWVETGTAVVELVGADAMWLDVRVPQERWPQLSAAAKIEARADALPTQPLAARLHARVPLHDASTRTFLARMTILDPPQFLAPGMSARIRFELPSEGTVLRLPRDALIRYPDGTTTVWILDTQGDAVRARERQVQIGRASGDQIEILSGVQATDRVITRGNEVLAEGEVVRVAEPVGG